MPRSKVKMPKLGDTVDEVVVVEWRVQVGDEVAAGESLMVVETDKVDADVPCPIAGRIVERLVEEQDEVAVGTVIAILEST